MSLAWSIGRLRVVVPYIVHNSKLQLSQLPRRRHAGTYLYRGQIGKEPSVYRYIGNAMSFFLWYWILYHCWYEYDHLVPSHHFPDPSTYTDEELGIPSDDED